MKFIKKSMVCFTTVMVFGMLAGCEKQTTENTDKYILPEGMEDCKIYTMISKNGGVLQVVRCPLSVTTTKSGKNTNVTVIEQEEVNKVQAIKQKKMNTEVMKSPDKPQEIQINGEIYRKVQE